MVRKMATAKVAPSSFVKTAPATPRAARKVWARSSSRKVSAAMAMASKSSSGGSAQPAG
jgi:hypothetical protein